MAGTSYFMSELRVMGLILLGSFIPICTPPRAVRHGAGPGMEFQTTLSAEASSEQVLQDRKLTWHALCAAGLQVVAAASLLEQGEG